MTSPQLPQVPIPANTLPVPKTPAPTFGNTDQDAFTGALDKLASLAVGNENINTHPGLMNALMASNATPQQAGAIDQFMAGVKAQNMYQLALEQGGKIVFTPAERAAMDAMNFDYSKVDATASSNQQATIDGLKAKGLVPTLNSDGTLATGPDGNLLTRAAPQQQSAPQSGGGGFFSGGIMSGLGRAFHDVTHNPVTNAMSEGWNVVDASVSGDIGDVVRASDALNQKTGLGNLFGGVPTALGFNPGTHAQMDAQRKTEMQAMGYDPNSLWSSLAFDAHGYSKTNIQPALDGWDSSGAPEKYGKTAAQMLPDALQFLKDPKGYQNQIIADPSLTPVQVGQKLGFLNTPEFQTFTRRLAADQGTIGNVMMQQLGVDPIKQSREYQIGSATTDLVASFYLDPTLLLGKTLTALRKSPIAINSLYDSERAASLLDPAKAGVMGPRARVINGWQSMIDSTNDIRTALAKGDSGSAAAAYASIKAKTPELEPLIGDFLGTVSPEFRTTAEGVSGLSDHVHQLGDGEPVTNLAEAAKYITERGGLLRLAGGKAAVETSYMPGAVSNFGYRSLKANFAAGAARRDAVRTASQEADYLEARNAGNLSEADQAVSDAAFNRADPAVPTNTIDLSKLSDYLPSAIDGVDMQSGLVVAAPDAQLIGVHVDQVKEALAQVKSAQQAALKSVTTDANGEQVMSDEALAAKAAAGQNLRNVQKDLASAIRAAVDRAPTKGDWADTLLPAEKGQVAYNLRRFGTAVAPADASAGESVKGWASPTAVAARARLGAARFQSLLPRNTTFDLSDPQTADKVYKYARFYLGKGSASNLAASFANGDLGTRKAVVEGLWDQVAHAAGLPRTSLGKEMLENARTGQQAYTHAGPGWLVDGQPVALHDGQVTKALTLDSFKDVQHAASKLGLYEATVGRLGTSQVVDSLFNQFRFGILAAPKTAYRNIIEPYAKAALDGMFGDAVKTRALTYSSSDDLAKLGQNLGVKGMTGEIPDSARIAAKAHFEDQLANGTKHQQAVARHTLSRIEKGDLAAMSGFGRTRLGDMASDMLSHVASFYRNALIRNMPEEELAHADELPQVLPQMAHNFGQQVVADRFDPYGAQGVRDITADGLVPKKIEYNLAAGDHPLLHGHVGDSGGPGTVYKRTGYDLASTDSTVGRARYINALAQRTHDAPEVSKSVVQYLRDEAAGGTEESTMRDTRGGSAQYHGSRKPLSHVSEGYYNNANIYGGAESFYTTDAQDIARGYAGKNGKVYQASEKAPVKFYDMEKPLEKAELQRLLGTNDNPQTELDDFVHDAINEALSKGNGKANLRQAMDAVRRGSASAGYSRDDVQEIFSSVQDNLLRDGYGGMTHKGGLLTGAEPHTVKIYLDPSKQIELREHEPLMDTVRRPADIQQVIDALDARKGPRLTAYGKIFRPDESDGTAIKALTPDEVALGKRQWAQDVVNDFRYMLTAEKGGLNESIANYISEHGTAPDEQWLADNVKNADLPRSVLAPQYEAMPVGGVQNLASALNDLEGKVFNRVVEGTIKRQSSMPFLASHYLKARAQQDASGILDQMVGHGIEHDAADELLKGQAIRQAYVRTEQMIDDPGLKTQFDIVARNLFMFPRAMQAFVRRWGGSLARDPFGARRMMLSLEATEHSGLVYRDENGELTFTYPGSQVMRDAMVAIGKIPGFQGFAKFPTGMDMTGKVMLAAPGFDQPFRFSMSPMINIPMRGVFSLFPEHADIWNEIDTALNGQLGAGRGITQQVEPSAIQKLVSAENPDERNSAFASAVIGAMAHLQAAGLAPGPNATASDIDTYKNQVKTQVRNQLFWRFAFGLIAPAPPSSLNENIDQSAAKNGGTGTGSDYSFNIAGIKNLSAEYKSILNSTNGDVARASQIFTYLHPEGLAYTVPTTQAGISKAQLPATTESLKWMESNLPFLDKYKSVGAYFLPKPQGQFDYNAYQAQLAIGLRQKKSIDEFYQSIQENQGLSAYYNEYNQYQQVKAQALASGDPTQAKVAAQAFSDWKTNFLAQNPFVAAKFATTASNKITGERQISDLGQMVKQGEVPDGLGPQVGQMLTIWNQYNQWKTSNTGNGAVSTGTRQAAADWVDQQLSAIAQSDPRLANIYNGVFRVIDSSLSKIG